MALEKISRAIVGDTFDTPLTIERVRNKSKGSRLPNDIADTPRRDCHRDGLPQDVFGSYKQSLQFDATPCFQGKFP